MPAIPIVHLSSFCCSYKCFAGFVSKLSNLFMAMFPGISMYFSFLEHLTGRVNLTKNVRAYPAITYLLKVNNRNSRKRCETCFTIFQCFYCYFEQLNVNQVFDSLRTDVRKQYLKNIFYKGGYENFQKIYKKAFAKKSIF